MMKVYVVYDNDEFEDAQAVIGEKEWPAYKESREDEFRYALGSAFDELKKADPTLQITKNIEIVDKEETRFFGAMMAVRGTKNKHDLHYGEGISYSIHELWNFKS